jgi:ketosteroid isomerase-like protein
MRRFVYFTLLAALALPILAARPAWAQSKEEQAIRALIDRTIQANNSVDEKVIRQAMTDLGTGTGPFYPIFTQSAASVADLEPLMTRTLAALSSRQFTVTGPIQIKAEKKLGWANYTWHVDATLRDGTKRSLDGRTTAAFALEGKNWKYVHTHSSVAAAFPLSGKELEAEGQAIIQIERNAWEAYKNKKIEAFNDYYADDASAFSDEQAYRVRGKADILRGMEASMKQSDLLAYQILDPQVQVLGDTALLTYYYSESEMKDGKSSENAGKVSMVFVRQGGKWRALHEHIATNQSPRRMNRP